MATGYAGHSSQGCPRPPPPTGVNTSDLAEDTSAAGGAEPDLKVHIPVLGSTLQLGYAPAHTATAAAALRALLLARQQKPQNEAQLAQTSTQAPQTYDDWAEEAMEASGHPPPYRPPPPVDGPPTFAGFGPPLPHGELPEGQLPLHAVPPDGLRPLGSIAPVPQLPHGPTAPAAPVSPPSPPMVRHYGAGAPPAVGLVPLARPALPLAPVMCDKETQTEKPKRKAPSPQGSQGDSQGDSPQAQGLCSGLLHMDSFHMSLWFLGVSILSCSLAAWVSARNDFWNFCVAAECTHISKFLPAFWVFSLPPPVSASNGFQGIFLATTSIGIWSFFTLSDRPC